MSFGQAIILSAQKIYPQKAVGLEVDYGTNQGLRINDAAKFGEDVKIVDGVSFGFSPSVDFFYKNLHWNHSLRINISHLKMEAELPNFGREVFDIIYTTKIRYQTSLWYPVNICRRFSAGPEIGAGLSFNLASAGPYLSNTAGKGHLNEFEVFVIRDNGDEELILSGYAGMPPKVHPYLVPGLKFQYEVFLNWFLQLRINYEVSRSQWLSESYFLYAPTGAESTLSYREGRVLSASVTVLKQGLFNKKPK